MQDLDYACGSRRCQGVSDSMPSAAIAASSIIGISAVVFGGDHGLAPLVLESREQLQERISTAAGSRVENQQEDRFATTRDVLIVLGGARARAEHDVLPRRPKNDCGCVAQQPTLLIPRLEPVRARSNVDLPRSDVDLDRPL